MTLAPALLVTASVLLAACSGEPPDERPRISGETRPPSCSGERTAMPSWVPKDLPLPDGTYAFRELEREAGFSRVMLVLPLGLEDLVEFLLAEWPPAGYSLGPGDTERGLEIEDTFEKPPAHGVFFAYPHCDDDTTVLDLIYRKKPGAVAFPPIGNRGDPLFPDALRKASPAGDD